MRTLILGATTNPKKYAFKTTERLLDSGYEIVLVGIRKGKVFGVDIINDKSIQENIHTITLYIGVERQEEWEQYLLDTKPKRVIFNPGTENSVLEEVLRSAGIEIEINCTLVMLSLGSFGT